MKSIEYLLKAYGMAKESKCEHDIINKSKYYPVIIIANACFTTQSFTLFCH